MVATWWRHGPPYLPIDMPVVHLTKRGVNALSPSERPVIYYDVDLKGFGIWVSPTGVKSWIVEYRAGAGGRGIGKRRMVLGSSSVLTPSEARVAARAVLAKAALGEDPAGNRSRERQTPTFGEFLDRYLAEEAAAKLKPTTVANYRICLRKHAVPFVGSKKIDRVTMADMARMHQVIGKTKPMTANRVIECVGSVYRYAAICGLVPQRHNPAATVRAFRENRRERFLSSAELTRLGDAIREAETSGIPYEIDETNQNSKHAPKPENRRKFVDAYGAAALRLLILTGARLREILNLKWEYVDFERGLLFLPDSKTGKKTIVLNALSLVVLSSLERAGLYVILGEDAEKPRADLKRPWDTVAKRAGLVGVRIHDLRHTYASFGVAGGVGLTIVGKLLGHSQVATTARYAHLDTDPLRCASDIIAGRIAAALEGHQSGAVLPIKRPAGNSNFGIKRPLCNRKSSDEEARHVDSPPSQ